MTKARLPLVAAIATALVAAVASYVALRPSDPWRTFLAIAPGAGTTKVAGRLSLLARQDHPGKPDPRLLRIALAVLDSGATEQQKATAALIAGRSSDAVQRLSRLVSKQAVPASVWNDYAVALIADGDRGDGTHLFQALAAADRSLDLDPAHGPAPFNRALVLDRLQLNAAGKHATRVRWQKSVPELERAAAAGDVANVASVVLQDRQQARVSAETELLGRWGEAVLSGDPAQAATLLSLSRATGQALREASGEAMLSDDVAAIDDSDAKRLRTLAAAHVAFRQARLLYARREVVRAIPLFVKAEELFEESASPMALTAAYYRANAAVDAGNRREAVALAGRIAARAPARYRALRAQVQWLRGTIFGFDGLFGDAMTSYERAAAEFTDLHEFENAVEMQYRIASVLTLLGRSAEAWRMHRRVLQAASAAGAQRPLEATLYAIATAALREERWDIGYSFLTLVVAIEDGNPWLHAEAVTWRALAAKRARMQRSATASLDRARITIAALPDPELRATVTNELRLVEALMVGGDDTRRSIALLSEHLRVAKNRRGEAPEVLVERGRLLRAQGDLDAAEEDFRRAIDILEARGRSIPGDVLRDSFISKSSSAYQLLSDLLDRRDAVEESLMIGDRRRARLVLDRIPRDGQHGGGANAAALVPPWTAILAYGLFEDRLVLYVTTSKGLHRYSVATPSRSVEAAARTFIVAVESNDKTRAASGGRALYELLIAPALPSLTDIDALAIVADGALEGVPFSALVQRDRRYLLETFRLTLAPSVEAWASRRRSVLPPRFRSILAVGNPQLDRERYPSLDPLPQAESEARAIGAMYPSRSVLLGGDATRARVNDALRHCNVAHFAGHAVADFADPGRSRILLASSDTGRDEAFTSSDVAALDLRETELVVLAGCQTAVTGKAYGYVRSLAAAFIAAGARNVVAALWNVDDSVSRPFSIAFHKALRAGLPPDAALQRAQLQLLRSGDASLSETRAWAAMQLYGAGN